MRLNTVPITTATSAASANPISSGKLCREVGAAGDVGHGVGEAVGEGMAVSVLVGSCVGVLVSDGAAVGTGVAVSDAEEGRCVATSAAIPRRRMAGELLEARDVSGATWTVISR